MGRIITSASLIAFLSCGAWGQGTTGAPVFEVASVRLNKTGVRGGSVEFSAGGERFTGTNMPFGAYMVIAYGITPRQLSAPDGFLSEKYDIAAKAEHAVSRDQMLRMLQALLADRFKLVLRREMKEVQVYALVVGRGGPKLQPTDVPRSAGANPRTPAGAGGTEPKSGHLIFKNESMSDFAWALSRVAGIGDRVVVDYTGLKGNYDFELKFERDSSPQAGAEIAEPATRREGPAIFTALQEQLGLRLESRKAPVEFFIIDRGEKPTEN